MRRLRRSILSFLPAFLWYSLIFGLSAQTGQSSSALSDGLAFRLLARVWPAFFRLPESERLAVMETLTFLLRKTAHMAAYFVLTGLLLWALRGCRTLRRRAAAAALLCTLLSGLDEFHQTFVPGRNGQLRDVCIDMAGAGCFLLLWLAFCRIRARRKNQTVSSPGRHLRDGTGDVDGALGGVDGAHDVGFSGGVQPEGPGNSGHLPCGEHETQAQEGIAPKAHQTRH